MKRSWIVKARGTRFTMGGEPMTHAEALAVVLSIFGEGSVE